MALSKLFSFFFSFLLVSSIFININAQFAPFQSNLDSTFPFHLSHYCAIIPNTHQQPSAKKNRSHDPRSCAQCPPGSSYNDYTHLCEACPPGWSRNLPHDICTPCSPGFYKSDYGIGQCRPCPPGTFTSSYASSKCVSCPPNTFSDSAADRIDVCMTCPKGFFWYTFTSLGFEQSQCIPCPSGHYSTKQNAKSCQPCPKGTSASLLPGKCDPCPPGTFSGKLGTVRCRPCPIGQYNPIHGATKCRNCPSKSVAPKQGMNICYASCTPKSRGCISCKPGTGRIGNTCKPCTYGTFSNYDLSTECVQCAPDTIPTMDKRKCKCKNGLVIKPTGPPFCEKCPPYAHSPDGIRCVCKKDMIMLGNHCRCRPGTKGPDLKGNCVPCTKQEINDPYHPSNACEFCPAGTGLDFKEGICRRCKGQYVTTLPTLRSCHLCPPTTIPNENHNDCTCKPGWGPVEDLVEYTQNEDEYDDNYKPPPLKCHICQAGMYSDSYTRTCNPCPPGTFSKIGANRCTPCPPGTRLGSWGMGSCPKLCPPGEIETDDGKACTCNKYSVRRNGKCVLCPYDGVSDKKRQSCGCAVSHARYGKGCIPCSKGYFADGWNCEKCAVGTAAGKGSYEGCDYCELGTESLFVGLERCELSCARGSFRPLPGGKCIRCAKGEYVSQGKCIKCPPGSGSEGGDVGSCVKCEKGSIVINGLCKKLNSLTKCESWHIRDSATGECKQCFPGTQKIDDNLCAECPAGTASDGIGFCKACGRDSSVISYGARSCDKCPMGMTSTEGGTECSTDATYLPMVVKQFL